ncbi:hypothetical protein [Nocardia jinanensis]|uniref:Uncharacterized protein n=1 Tax=Nocardia jinanensis TaxID=382504 RepID=A0A917VYZ2_9NOCA|nr:hypothetical protein [Nocardia jinanensis]GGL46735.1 hypothetical protein GCM10011588_72000 [Nocardia jinanensis]
MTADYEDYESLKGVYLEDSYVMDIVEGPDFLRFTIEAVLTPDNPRYSPPKPGEQYCYVDSTLTFEGVSKSTWDKRNFRKYKDASGEEDYGNIDSLLTLDDGYRVEGDWGSVRIWSNEPPRLRPLTPDNTNAR